MKNLLQKKLISLFKSQSKNTFDTLLFDSIAIAQDVAFMLNADWDECNGVIIDKYDEVAINTAAKLYNSAWCKQGDQQALLARLTVEELVRRYAVGERIFCNANLRCADLAKLTLPSINLSYAKLNQANLTETNFSGAELTAADLTIADLSHADLSKSCLNRANLTKANLSFADLRGATLQGANLSEACLYQADLRGTNLSLADLRGADLTDAKLEGANLTNTQLTLTEYQKAALKI